MTGRVLVIKSHCFLISISSAQTGNNKQIINNGYAKQFKFKIFLLVFKTK